LCPLVAFLASVNPAQLYRGATILIQRKIVGSIVTLYGID